MEMTPQEIDHQRTSTEIARHVGGSFSAGVDFARMERAAMRKFPPAFRTTQPVPEAIRNLPVLIAKSKHQTQRKQHVLP